MGNAVTDEAAALRTNACDGAKAAESDADATTKADTATEENFMIVKTMKVVHRVRTLDHRENHYFGAWQQIQLRDG